MLSSIFLTSLLLSSAISAQARVVESKHKLNLRPKVFDPHRSSLEAAYLTKRGDSAGTGAHSCGNSDGAILNPATIVRDALVDGLPYASDTGVIFMRASVTDTTGCGPYECSVSTDASGSSWLDMPILTDVPTAQAGCGAAGSATDYSLVAQLPANTVCTGDGGACLIMCKSQRALLGNCAAIAYSPAGPETSVVPSQASSSVSAPASVQPSPAAIQTSYEAVPAVMTTVISAVDATSFVTTTQIIPTTQTTSIPATPSRLTPAASSASSRSSSAVASNKPIATIVGFSGDNGPGGLAEQHVGNSGFAVTSKDLNQGQSSGASRSSHVVALLGVASAALVILAMLV